MNELDQVKDYLQSLQNRIVAELEQLDGTGVFRRDAWDRAEGGGGISCILSDGAVFEQAGVSRTFSATNYRRQPVKRDLNLSVSIFRQSAYRS